MSYLELKGTKFKLVLDGMDALWLVRFLSSFPIDPGHCDECGRWYQKLLELREAQLFYLQALGVSAERVTHEPQNHAPQGRWSPEA